MGTALVRTDALTKAYRHKVALHGVTFEIEPGEVFGYLGPNGAGKTTTIRLLMGLLRPTSGTAHILGHDVWAEPVAVHRRTGYVPGEPALYDKLTGRQHVAYCGHLRGDADDKRALALAERLDLDLDVAARTLSKGNKQKLSVVLALMSGPPLLVLDEPTTGLDPFAQGEFNALLREHVGTGGSVLLSSHILAEVQRMADRVAILRDGNLVAVERLDDLRGKSMHHVNARFDDAITSEEFARIPGVRDVTVADRDLACRAPQAALDELLRQASRHRVIDFECFEAELEETFLTYYGTGG